MGAGRYITQLEGYRAFIPAPLPPDPPISMDAEMVSLLSEADHALGRLDGVASILPNPDLFVATYVRHEAVLSSQIEGTQSSLEDVLEYEAGGKDNGLPHDVEDVVNYVRAMNHGLSRLKVFPLSLRLIREIHAELLRGVRGGEKDPGNFRRTQNWIGPKDAPLQTAVFVPPPAHEMTAALDNLEKFLHETEQLPALIHCGMVHAQFETIHPFIDGNGRVGRLLIVFQLCQRGILQRPLLYPSYYLKARRTEYYDRLMAVRNEGNWEGWLKFFLRGVVEARESAAGTARGVPAQRENHRGTRGRIRVGAGLAARLLDLLFEHPVMTARSAEKLLGCAYVTAGKLLTHFEKAGIVIETTRFKRNRRYRYEPLLQLFKAIE